MDFPSKYYASQFTGIEASFLTITRIVLYEYYDSQTIYNELSFCL